jgi:hypothetical protein
MVSERTIALQIFEDGKLTTEIDLSPEIKRLNELTMIYFDNNFI